MSSKKPFRFQQFTVRDDRAAMKIGTDAVLLGAWTPLRNATRIVDIGTGCGIIAQMLAQRSLESESIVAAIDVEAGAAAQALENFSASPWPDRLPQSFDAVHRSVEQLSDEVQKGQPAFDLAVCNPPFFAPSSPSPEDTRRTARQTESLSVTMLLRDAVSILTAAGRLCLVLPFEQTNPTIELANSNGFHLWSRTDVRPTPNSNPKRVLFEFGLVNPSEPIKHDSLIVETSRHEYSADYAELTRAFHLRYADNYGKD